jgi:hypothetical protein
LADSLKGFGEEDVEEKEEEEEEYNEQHVHAPVNPDDGDEEDIYAVELSDDDTNAPFLSTVKVDRDGLPFACFICRNRFIDPVETICRHYFCRRCIEAATRRNKSTCPICQKNTLGVFNKADKLIRKLKKMKR